LQRANSPQTRRTARSVERLSFLLAGGHGRDLLKANANFAKARSGLPDPREAHPDPLSGFLEKFRAMWKSAAGLERPVLCPTVFQKLFAQGQRSIAERGTCRNGAGDLAEGGMRLGCECTK
jgi:hypothetical protein